MSAVWDHSQASGGTLLVLLALADRADEDGFCYPGVERIRRKSRMSERAVQDNTKRLVAMGELKITRRSGDTNLYQITLPGLGGAESAPVQNRVAEKRESAPNTSETDASSSNELDGAERPQRECNVIASKHLTPILEVVTDGYGYDLRVEIERVWTPAFAEARAQDVNPNAVGIAIAGAYVHALLGRDLQPREWGQIGRLVKSYGKIALRGLEAAYMRATDEAKEGDPVRDGNWLAYATRVCQNLMQEAQGDA